MTKYVVWGGYYYSLIHGFHPTGCVLQEDEIAIMPTFKLRSQRLPLQYLLPSCKNWRSIYVDEEGNSILPDGASCHSSCQLGGIALRVPLE